MKIVFVGNFDVPFSTESHHKWTWEHLGHQVVPLQENKTSTDAILDACRGANLLQWTHTHGWGFAGSITAEEMLKRVKLMGVPSFSYHLDVYWGLNALDRREDRIGRHPSWKVDYFFSTDGSHEKEFAARGVNHHYLPPGVVEYGCFKGQQMPALASDIGFVGSIGYHPEYPYRTRLVEELKKHYGIRFRTYAGMREAALNNTYASSKVIVGDHCFATNPNYLYWSDRLPETLGRGGFMLYPFTAGLNEFIQNGLVTYQAGDFRQLYEKIDYYLDPARHQEVEDRRTSLMDYVKKHHTYTQRLQTIVKIIFG